MPIVPVRNGYFYRVERTFDVAHLRGLHSSLNEIFGDRAKIKMDPKKAKLDIVFTEAPNTTLSLAIVEPLSLYLALEISKGADVTTSAMNLLVSEVIRGMIKYIPNYRWTVKPQLLDTSE